MRAQDTAAVIAIAAVVPTAPHWPEPEFHRMLRVAAERPLRRGAWVAVCPEGAIRGFAMATQVAGMAELEAVVTAPEFRGQGIGGALLTRVLAWGRETGAERLSLEARSSNKEALRLYARHGFKPDGLRRGYYRHPEEDAVLLSTCLMSDAPG